jgi:hypothetical protein
MWQITNNDIGKSPQQKIELKNGTGKINPQNVA